MRSGPQLALPAPPPFTGTAVDRVSAERKDPEWVRERAGDPSARWVAAGRDGVLVSADDQPEPALVRLTGGRERIEAEPVLLGLEEERPLFALDLDRTPAHEGSARGRVISLREAGTVLPRAEAGLAAYLAGLLNWHRAHGFCSRCGAASEVTEGGHSRRCPRCRAMHFPRTDPVVIMSVEHDGRLLLGRRAGGPEGRLSVLAGFVSPGESLEEAVVREVREETGIVARDPVFVASQPWPFPASLMLGFHAVSDGGEPAPSDGELDEVHWLTRAEVSAAASGEGPFRLPPPVSIARHLIERWILTVP